MDIKITRTQTPKEKPDQNSLGFGKYMTDHMFIMDYDAGEGWHDARIVPYGPIPMEPNAIALHYAQETFEGLKAYRRPESPAYMLCENLMYTALFALCMVYVTASTFNPFIYFRF